MTRFGITDGAGFRGLGLRTPTLGFAIMAAVFGVGLRAADDVVTDEPAPRIDRRAQGPAGGMQVFVWMGANHGQFRGRAGLPPVPVAEASPTVELGSLFDRIVFGPEVGGTRSEAEGLAVLRGRGEARITLLDEICGLSSGQRRALRLTLASDVNAFSANLAALRSRYSGIDMPVRPGAMDRELLAELRADATACRSRWRQFFGPASLLGVVESDVLEPHQTEALTSWIAARRDARWRGMVEAVLLADGGIPWRSDDAAAQAVTAVSADVPPLAVFAAACDPALEARMTKLQQSLVHLRLGRVPERTIRPLVQPGQWAGVRSLIDRAQEPGTGNARVEQELIARQVLEEPNP
jgi:hypothetical protein